MTAYPAEIPFLSTISLMLTYKCTIACPHCIVGAGPNRKEEMSLRHALDWIDEAASYRKGMIKGIALTGGEPFYNISNLVEISSHAKQSGFVVSVVTNAFWAVTEEQAIETLQRVPALQMISISTDIYHQQFITLENIRNAVQAARQLGRHYNIAICTDSDEDERYKAILDTLKTFIEPEKIRIAITFPAGRAQKHQHTFNHQTSPEPTVSACSMTSAPVVFPDGKVMACIGPLLTLPESCPMCLGNLQKQTLAEILDQAELNPVLHIIRVWGPHKLVSLLREYEHGDLLPKEYICNSHCDICYKLLSNDRIIALLSDILEEKENLYILAYARMHYLKEPDMIQKYHLDGTEHIDLSNKLLQPDRF